MVKKSITIPDDIYEQVCGEENFSSLVTELLSEHIRQKRLALAKSSFGSCESEISGVDYINMVRAEGSRKLLGDD